MNKRKASAEGNDRQKPTSRRPSTASMLAKNNSDVPPRRSGPEKSPSTQNLRGNRTDSSKTTLVNKGVEVCLPKTRFSSGDRYRGPRSSSSPRLKSFPAERVKKVDSPPPFSPKPMAALIVQQDPRETGSLFVVPPRGQSLNGGQGDAIVGVETVYPHRQSAGSTSQQQVASHQALHQVGQTNPNSESMLVHQTISPNSQVHRPFVPSVPHAATVHNHSPRKTVVSPPIINTPVVPQNFRTATETFLTTNPKPSECPRNATAARQEDIQNPENQTRDLTIDYEKQPVGGRNADLHRKVTLQQKQPAEPRSQPHVNDSGWNEPADDGPAYKYARSNMYSPNNRSPPYLNHRSPQQAYQQMQQNIVHQQQLQQRAMDHRLQMMTVEKQAQQQQLHENRDVYCNYYEPQQPSGHYFPGQGMTSQQDLTVNQLMNYRNLTAPVQPYFPMHQRDMQCAGNPQNRWVQNDHAVNSHLSAKAQLKPFAVDLVDNDQTPCQMPHQRLVDEAAVGQYHCQRPPITQQRFYGDPPQNCSTARQPAHVNHRVTQPSRQPPSEGTDLGKPSGKKRIVQFTPEMIRDQELLVSTMRQQGISDDVMRRQFEALLSEQRKHLLYVEQLQRREDSPERKSAPVSVRTRKRIDEKPEWMIHITPPRVSYTDLERLNARKRAERSNPSDKPSELTNARQEQQKINETCGKEVQSPQAQPNTQHTCNFSQQHLNSQQFGNAASPYANAYTYGHIDNATSTRNTMNHNPGPSYNPTMMMHQQHHCQHPQNMPYLQPSHQRGCNSQLRYPEAYQDDHGFKRLSNHGVRRDLDPAYDEKKRTDEPCSLLKMRVYKEIIRPQKRNNGLQDAETIQKALEVLSNPKNRKGLEYLNNLTGRQPTVKLNGVQEPEELHPDLLQRPTAESLKAQKRISANGLENSRNPNNPSQRRLSSCIRRSDQDTIWEYPRQRQNNPRYCYSMQAERENGTVAIQRQRSSQDQRAALPATEFHPHGRSNVVPYNESNPVTARHNVMPFKFDGPYPQSYQQIQRGYGNGIIDGRSFDAKNGEGDVDSSQRHEGLNSTGANRAGGDACESLAMNDNGRDALRDKIQYQPCGIAAQKFHGQNDIQEARTIGGITYLARKPDYIPSSQMIAPETLIASRHLQPPVFY